MKTGYLSVRLLCSLGLALVSTLFLFPSFVSAASVFSDGFESYSTGGLSTKVGSGWFQDSGDPAILVTSDEHFFGSNSITTGAVAPGYATKHTFATSTVGYVGFWFFMPTDSSGGLDFRVRDTGTVNDMIYVLFRSVSSTQFSLEGYQTTEYARFNKNEWYYVAVSWDGLSQNFQVNIHGVDYFLPWVSTNLGTGLDAVSIGGLQTTAAQFYLDNLEVYQNSAYAHGDYVTVEYPVDGLYAAPNFPAWGVSLHGNYASTTVLVALGYGQNSVAEQYFDTGYFWASTSETYFIKRNTEVDLTAGQATPQTWYVRAYVYYSPNNDGDFSTFLATSSQVSFVYYPGATPFTATTTAFGFIEIYGTSTCPAGIICTGTGGTRFYVDQNGNVVVLSTTTVSTSGFKKFTDLWQAIRYKIPWGYIGLLQDAYNRGITATTSTTTNWYSLPSLSGQAQVLSYPLSYLYTGVSVIIWIMTAVLIIKIVSRSGFI